MASIRVRPDSGKLFLDFRVRGVRCRELTELPDTKENRTRLRRLLAIIEREVAAGTFDYRKHFPNSRLADRFDGAATPTPAVDAKRGSDAPTTGPSAERSTPITPTFSEFSATWFAETRVAWRESYLLTVRDILDLHLIPHFGSMALAAVQRSTILEFRAKLVAKSSHRKGKTLSAARVNTIMMILRQILDEAADHFDFASPYRRVKPLKIRKSDVRPFTLPEVELILARVRKDYRDYYLVRFFTGMRTGEIDGLEWKYVDFDRRLILIRETVVAGKDEYTKTDASQRDIQMSQPVFEALQRQHAATANISVFVFCNGEGKALEHNNVTKRVWYPLLRHLKLEKRRPYETRHTAATLWLASGENPEWVAKQLGHANTQMLFTVYSRFVPNLTRNDGSAFERMVAATLGNAIGTATSPAAAPINHRPGADKH